MGEAWAAGLSGGWGGGRWEWWEKTGRGKELRGQRQEGWVS